MNVLLDDDTLKELRKVKKLVCNENSNATYQSISYPKHGESYTTALVFGNSGKLAEYSEKCELFCRHALFSQFLDHHNLYVKTEEYLTIRYGTKEKSLRLLILKR